MHQPQAWEPPAPELRELQALVRRLEALDEMRLMEENRLGSGGLTAAVQDSLRSHLAFLHEQIEVVRRQIKDHPPKGHPPESNAQGAARPAALNPRRGRNHCRSAAG
jgi:hypothetical protein